MEWRLIVWFCVFYMFRWWFILDWFKMSQDENDLSTNSHVGKPRRTIILKFNPNKDGKWIATLMRQVHIVRKRGKRI